MLVKAPPRERPLGGLLGEGLVTDESVDWDAVALKYELSGGFIKNALLAAVGVRPGAEQIYTNCQRAGRATRVVLGAAARRHAQASRLT